ncbi:MAG: DUF4440 domain-containing protein [Bacteroidetes bacterium]|nr:DUF4440 domain-containing protein [Bacteroidota bacterium]
MNKKTSTALLIFLIAALLGTYIIPTMKENMENKTRSSLSHIPGLILKQSEAWNQGSLECFMSLYEQSDSLPFLTAKGVSYGWQNLHDMYQRTYFNSNSENRGILKFEITQVISIESGVCLVPGDWQVTRTDTVLSGKFSLLFKFFDKEGWKIIADHTW